jgi:hypothetical protein
MSGADLSFNERATWRGPGVGFWMGAAFCATLASAIAVLMLEGTGQSGTGAALRLTARVSFLFFWPAYVGSALAILFGRAFNSIARRGREFGLAFASAQFVHLALVVWLAWISAPQPLREAVMPFFAIGMVWTYLLALASLDYARNTLRPNFLRVLRLIGLEYIALTFIADFIMLPKHTLQHPVQYLPFSIMIGVGPVLRLAALTRRGFAPRSMPIA